MPLAKILLQFLAKFSVIYILLIIPQTNIGQAYAGFIRTQGELIFGRFGNYGVVKFERNDEKKNKWESRNKMLLINGKEMKNALQTGEQYQMAKVYNSWYYNYLFVALLMALIIATPIALKRKLWALIWGFILIHLYINFGLFIKLLYKFDAHAFLGVVDLQGFWHRIVEFIYPILMVNPGTGIFIAVIIWLVVCFRKEDLSHMINKLIMNDKSDHAQTNLT